MPSEAFDPGDITLSETAVGQDILLLITGGVRHIGAASTAYIGENGAEVTTSAVPGHKEHTISESVAVKVAEALRRTVTVVMGIHYDDLSKEQIARVVEIVERRVELYLAGKK
ncbi:hypothetical protein [Paenibacillus rhizophilus]|uniref:Prenylated flavin chaperone LpdD-like domain-containing protein n=1 Tax=Paenibacillus rhizophilus TaxID=1850366 RepID=A0A3N9Q3K7_9BACL|nr:hypothetical protein [Paenibacillus rhizophilus]RQW13322.1 hypothetical protein EH198_02505 [Paenibacillus rhizophilus]